MMLPRVLDAVMDLGGSFRIEELRVGTGKDDPSTAQIVLQHETAAGLDSLISACQAQGAVLLDTHPARLEPAPRDGVFPDAFYSTSNQPTQVLVKDGWIDV